MSAKARWRAAADRVLGAKRPRIAELLSALDEVNPTPRALLGDDERAERYALKARLQTRLVELYPDVLELRRDGEGLVLALRGGRDAKHVIRHTLGEGAQAWFGQELARLDLSDLADEPLPSMRRTEARLRAEPTDDDPEELVANGDYERAVELLVARGRAGSVSSAARCLELLLDYLDRPAEVVAAAEGFPPSVGGHPSVAGPRSVALVRSGRVDEAERTLRGVLGPETTPAWKELGAARLAAGDPVGTRRAADRLEEADRGMLEAATALRRGAAALVDTRLAGDLLALERAVDGEAWEDVERLATGILQREPAHRAARAGLAEAARARAEAEAKRAFREAEAHEHAGRWKEAAARFRVAAEAGQPEGARRAAEAQRRASDRDREVLVAGVARAMADDPRAGLTRTAHLEEDERADLRSQLDGPGVRLLEWLEAVPLGRTEVRVAAALALSAASDAMASGQPREAFAYLEPHLELVERMRAARPLVAAAREGVERLERDRAQALLEMAERASGSDLAEAGRALAQVPARLLDAAARERLARLEHFLTQRGMEQGRITSFDSAVLRDPLAALRLVGARKSGDWEKRRSRALEALRIAWRVHDLRIDASPRDLSIPDPSLAPVVGLDLSRGVAWIPEAAGHWVTLSEVPIGGGPVGRALALRTKRSFRVSVHIAGRHAWVDSGLGAVCLDLDRGLPCDRMDEAGILSTRPALGGVWWRPTNGRWRWQETGGEPRVLDLDLEALIAVPGRTNAVALDAQGDLVTVAPDGRRTLVRHLGSGVELLTACAHPTDEDAFVLVLHAPKDQRTDLITASPRSLDVLARTKGRPLRHTFASSRSTGLIYVLEPGNDAAVLTAMALDGRSRFVTPVRAGGALFVDALGERCALAVDARDGAHVVPLGDQAPELPTLGPRHLHGPQERECFLNAPDDLADLVDELEHGGSQQAARVQAWLDRRPGDRRHEERVVTALGLSWPDRAEALAGRLGIDPRSVPLLALALTDDSDHLLDFRRMGGLLDEVAMDELPEHLRSHARHVRALVAVARGDLAAARADLKAAHAQPTECPVDALLDWVEVMDGSNPERPEPAEDVRRSWWEIRRAMAEARGALSAGDPVAASRAFGSSASRCEHPQVVAARAAVLLADPATPWWERLRGLARVAEDEPDAPLPGEPDRGDLADLLQDAERWLASDATLPELRVARLLLAEAEDGLRVGWQVAYGGVAPGQAPWVEVHGRRVRRSEPWEAEVAALFEHDVGPGEVVLGGDDAWRFLEERLPELTARWEIHAQHRLTRVVPARPIGRTRGGRVSLGFDADGLDLPADEALRAWLAGRHYVRLDDATVARLPTAWMRRFAEEAAEALEAEARRTRAPPRPKCWSARDSHLSDAAAGRAHFPVRSEGRAASQGWTTTKECSCRPAPSPTVTTPASTRSPTIRAASDGTGAPDAPTIGASLRVRRERSR